MNEWPVVYLLPRDIWSLVLGFVSRGEQIGCVRKASDQTR